MRKARRFAVKALLRPRAFRLRACLARAQRAKHRQWVIGTPTLTPARFRGWVLTSTSLAAITVPAVDVRGRVIQDSTSACKLRLLSVRPATLQRIPAKSESKWTAIYRPALDKGGAFMFLGVSSLAGQCAQTLSFQTHNRHNPRGRAGVHPISPKNPNRRFTNPGGQLECDLTGLLDCLRRVTHLTTP